MNQFSLLRRCVRGILLSLLCSLSLVSCEQTFIHTDTAMPGVWLVEDIVDTSSEGWGYLPFELGDEVEFTDYGRLTIRAEGYEASGEWWAEEKFSSTLLYIRMDGEEEITSGRIKEVSGGRIVWAVYPQYWDGYWDGYPYREITLLWTGE